MKKTQLNWGFLGAAKIGRSLAPAIVASKYARAYAVASRAARKRKPMHERTDLNGALEAIRRC